jgi:anti-sigma factor RsiW
MILLGGRCREHRDDLALLADPDRLGEPQEAVFAHLEACPRCRSEAEAAISAAHGLRRLAAESRRAAPTPGSWLRLRARLESPREPRWRWRSSVMSLVAGSALVGLLLAPAAVWPERVIRLEEVGTDPVAVTAFRVAEAKGEVAALDHQRFIRSTSPIVGMPRADDQGAPAPTAVEVGWSGPDGRGVTPIRLVASPPPADRTK